jgi:hypothetical protein
MRFLITLIALTIISGCNNLSPRNDVKQELQNQQGKINGLENNQNAIKSEIGRLSNDLGVQNSKLKDLQEGWLNFKSTLSENENSGVQILQGDGSLFLVFSTITIVALLYFAFKANKYQQTAHFLSKQISEYNDASLNQKIINNADPKIAKTIYNLMK